MSPTLKSRRQKLEEFVAANPADAFARYGLAMECKNAGDYEAAVQNFQQLLSAWPNYVPAYLHYGQLLAQMDRREEAREILTRGIAAAEKAADFHARDQMEAALREIQ